MKYYKVIYKIGNNNVYVYPSGVKGATWNIAEYHFTDNVMIGKTDSDVKADGVDVIKLTEKEASSLIEEFKKSYPEIDEEEEPLLPERPARTKSVRTKSSVKKSK